ncbi:unnamed protein product [Acanthosepion pharaonis]|uniref:Uncharacterized protein n=1 Tax=Acanthosepion pharaonis TaxID=158019 RepID=A0A812CGV2_ACAPH|nr:unnamed protein product [Sepia pharaonis]
MPSAAIKKTIKLSSHLTNFSSRELSRIPVYVRVFLVQSVKTTSVLLDCSFRSFLSLFSLSLSLYCISLFLAISLFFLSIPPLTFSLFLHNSNGFSVSHYYLIFALSCFSLFIFTPQFPIFYVSFSHSFSFCLSISMNNNVGICSLYLICLSVTCAISLVILSYSYFHISIRHLYFSLFPSAFLTHYYDSVSLPHFSYTSVFLALLTRTRSLHISLGHFVCVSSSHSPPLSLSLYLSIYLCIFHSIFVSHSLYFLSLPSA